MRAETLRLTGGTQMEIARAGFGQAIEIMDRRRREPRHGVSQRRRQHFAAAQHRTQFWRNARQSVGDSSTKCGTSTGRRPGRLLPRDHVPSPRRRISGPESSRAPFVSVNRLTQRPKMKVSCSGDSTTSPGVMLSRRSRAASLSARRRWPTTTPLGSPVLPEVKMTRAASRSSARSGGGAVTDRVEPLAVEQKSRAGYALHPCDGRRRSGAHGSARRPRRPARCRARRRDRTACCRC